MTKTTPSSTIPPCGCRRCPCPRSLRCRCHDQNALIALALWDYGRMLRRKTLR